jgi:hypothetical protein
MVYMDGWEIGIKRVNLAPNMVLRDTDKIINSTLHKTH